MHVYCFFFFNDTATTEIYTLSLHDALPISRHSAQLLRPILTACGLARNIVDKTCRLVEIHEVGGDPEADLLKDADSISYFDVNLPLYYQREGWAETQRRSRWGYRRLTPRAQEIVKNIEYEDEDLISLMKTVIDPDEKNNFSD